MLWLFWVSRLLNWNELWSQKVCSVFGGNYKVQCCQWQWSLAGHCLWTISVMQTVVETCSFRKEFFYSCFYICAWFFVIIRSRLLWCKSENQEVWQQVLITCGVVGALSFFSFHCCKGLGALPSIVFFVYYWRDSLLCL